MKRHVKKKVVTKRPPPDRRPSPIPAITAAKQVDARLGGSSLGYADTPDRLATDGLVCLGAIQRSHGLAGDVVIHSYTEEDESILHYAGLCDGRGRVFAGQLRGRLSGHRLVVRIEGCHDRDTADRWRGTRLYAPAASLPATEEDEWYHHELVGLVVRSAQHGTIGSVVAIRDFGAGDLLEIQSVDHATTALIPFSRHHFPIVSPREGWITLAGDAPEEWDTANG